MKYCMHYIFDEDSKKYVSLAIRYIGDKNPSKVHKFRCKRCGIPLHTVDVINLNNKINSMNRMMDNHDDRPIWLDKSDIYDMLKPVPGTYHEDSKYRDNQFR